MILYAHPTGNANVRQSLQALADAGLLAEFWTCLSWNPDGALARLLPGTVRGQFDRRSFSAAVRARAHTVPWRELGRLFAPHFGRERLTRHETGCFSVDAVFRAFDRKVAGRVRHLSGIRGVYAGEDAARETFRSARKRGIPCFYELPIGYWRAGRALYEEERALEPEWAATLTGLQDSAEKLARKEEELQQADVVLVASSFTRATLAQAPEYAGRVYVTPYGAPAALAGADPEPSDASTLRVLFVGALTQRKGLSYLLRAVASLRDHVALTLIGRKTGAPCAPLEAALRTHRWIASLSHQDVLEEMRRHDVLVFPSLFEGFGLVILEAMAQGVPVITTPHTAGPDLITDGVDGFLVPIRSAEAIAARLETLLRHPEQRQAMREAALARAKSCSWAQYRETIQRIIRTGIAAQDESGFPRTARARDGA